MHKLLYWDAGLLGVDHYGCQTLQHSHVGGTLLYCRRNEQKKPGWITLRLGILLSNSV